MGTPFPPEWRYGHVYSLPPSLPTSRVVGTSNASWVKCVAQVFRCGQGCGKGVRRVEGKQGIKSAEGNHAAFQTEMSNQGKATTTTTCHEMPENRTEVVQAVVVASAVGVRGAW